MNSQVGEALRAPTTQLTIRPLEPADRETVQAIRKAAFEPIFGSFRAMVGEEIAELAFANADSEQAKLLDDICADATQHPMVVSIDGTIVAFVSFSIDAPQRTGEIGLNAVHPDYAGRGIGTWMYEYVLAEMRQLGMALAVVGTGGDPSHAAARRSYEKAGFGPAIPSVYLYTLLTPTQS